MNRFYILTLSIMLAVMPALSEKRSITLDETILMARSRSVDAQVAVNAFRSAY